MNTMVIHGEFLDLSIQQWGDHVQEQAAIKLDPRLARRVYISIDFFTRLQRGDLPLYLDESIHALVDAGIVNHIECVVSIQSRILPTKRMSPARTVFIVEDHWTAAKNTIWDKRPEQVYHK